MTFWKYWLAALAAVTISTKAGIWYRMRGSLAANIEKAWSITTG